MKTAIGEMSSTSAAATRRRRPGRLAPACAAGARRGLTASLLVLVCAACSAAIASGPVPRRAAARSAVPTLTVTVGRRTEGPPIADDFLGLSVETPTLGQPAIVQELPSLARLLQGLGPGLLRISGDSVDRTQWLAPGVGRAAWATATVTPEDLAQLAALMRAAGWRLVLGLNLGHANAAAMIQEVAAAASVIGPSLAAVEIGNEPDLFTRRPARPFRSQLGASALRHGAWGPTSYESESARLAGALSTAGIGVPLWGPDTATSQWFGAYAARAPGSVAMLTPHVYPLDRCQHGRITRGPAIDSLLSARVRTRQSLLVASYARAALSRGLPLRVDETNSVACAGQPGVSDTFAAALWALDYGLTAARAGVLGLNFHGGLGPCAAGGTLVAPWYSPLCSLPDGRLHARPEYYALLALRSLEGCTFVPASYRVADNLSAYALQAPDGTLRIVLDDMDVSSGGGARAARPQTRGPQRPPTVRVVVQADPNYVHASVIRLSAPSLGAKRGVTLGGRSLRPDGSFPGTVAIPAAGTAGRFTLQIAAGSAAVVTLGR